MPRLPSSATTAGRSAGLLLATLAALQLGCGSKPGAGGPGPVVRLTVEPAAITLTAPGQAVALEVTGYDAAGAVVPGLSPTFSSSRPAEIAVSPAGSVTATAPVGSAALVARVGEVASAPVAALAVTLAAGVKAVTDEQLRGLPSPLATGTAAAPQARATLVGVPAPAVGDLLVGTGAKPLGGRVLAVRAVGEAFEVDLELTPVTALVKDLSVDLTFAPGDLVLQGAPPTTAHAAAGRPLGRTVGRFECQSAADLAPLTGEFEAAVTPSLTVHFTDQVVDGQRVSAEAVAEGTIEASAKAIFRMGAAFLGSVSCALELGRLAVPVFGLASMAVAPTIPLRVDAELTSAVSAAAFTFGAEGQLRAAVKLGVRQPAGAGPAEGFRSFEVTHDLQRTATFPTEAGARAKAAVFVGLGSGLDLSIGNLPGGSLASWQVVKAQAGPELELRVGTPYETALDPTFTTGYDLKGKVAVGPGESIEAVLERFFLAGRAVELTAKAELPLGRSPKASRVEVSADTFSAGDRLEFTVALDPAAAEFPGVGYDVSEVRIYRLSHGAPAGATLVASAPATARQLSFTIPWVASAAGQAYDPVERQANFQAYLVDRPLSLLTGLLPLELGPAAARPTSFPGAGETWTAVATPDANLRLGCPAWVSRDVAVSFSRRCDDFAAGTNCREVLMRSVDAGLTWTEVVLPAGERPGYVAFANEQLGVTFGTSILRTIDGGQTWSSVSAPSYSLASAVWKIRWIDATHVVALGGWGGNTNVYYRSADGGLTWRGGSLGSWPTYAAFDMDVASDGTVIVAGGGKALWRSADFGASWTLSLPPTAHRNAFVRLARAGGVLIAGAHEASGQGFSLGRSEDLGATWSWAQLGVGTSPLFTDISFADAANGAAFLYNGTPAAQIFVTSDGGLTWRESSATPTNLVPNTACEVVFSPDGVGLGVASSHRGLVRSLPGGPFAP